MRPEELIVQRRQTMEFIQVNPCTIRFHRETARTNARGGIDHLESWTMPQRVRFVRSPAKIESTTAGSTKRCYDRIIARHDADMGAGDEFEYEGEDWRVVKILPRSYEKVADVELK